MNAPTASRSLVLVTGGAGYIGSVLVPTLLEAGYRIRVLDTLLYGDAGLAGVRERIELIAGDIRTLPGGILEDVRAVVNLAGLSAEPAAEYRPEINKAVNHHAAVRLARAAKAAGVERFVQASSGSIYDVGAGHADRDIVHTEDFPVEPFRIYSITKREAEKGILALGGDGFAPVVFRKGSVYGYGPRMRMDLVVNTFVYNAMKTGRLVLHNGGEMWRPLVHVRDVAKAYLAALEAPVEGVCGQIINVVYGNYRISELALRIRHALSKLGITCDLQPEYEYRNLRSCQAANQKIRERLGFTPGISVEEAVEELVEKIRTGVLCDLGNPILHNIRWVDWLEEAKNKRGYACDVFDLSAQQLAELRQVAAGSAP